ncbi:hypothetical protein LDENG_00106320 [Lucifuga dentata]|nr:hypothetical protein LDENG_00106320 [Lucifuga dentata]
MERDHGFNFKLLVPPRVNSGQVSAVRPQEIVEDCCGVKPTLQQVYNKCFEKEQSMLSPTTRLAVTPRPSRHDFPKMKVVPPMEKDERNLKPGETFFKLYDEVEKIRCWKVKAESDNVQRERKLQENQRIIETQRKVIQELQFGNESLSITLEKQISENEDLRMKYGFCLEIYFVEDRLDLLTPD